MWKIVKIIIPGLFVPLISSADVSLTHLEKLKSRYPFGLIGTDYGILTYEDLAVNTCNTLEITPFSGDKNMAYPYWQCLPLKDTKIECEHAGFDPSLKIETAYLELDAQNENGLQAYLARDAMDVRECKKYLSDWSHMTRGEAHICISGTYGGFSGVRDGHKETDWVFHKFKTRKGCKSHRSACNLKELASLEHCLLPANWPFQHLHSSKNPQNR